MILYNLRTSELGFKVTKFDDDLEPVSSYDMSSNGETCSCPRAASPTCRHRQMFAELQERVDTAWFYDFDGAKQWHDPTGAYAPGIGDDTEEEAELAEVIDQEEMDAKPEPAPVIIQDKINRRI